MARILDPIARVRRHRQQWPLDRIERDPSGFRAECERVLISFSMPNDRDETGGWPDHWLDLLFGDSLPQAERQAGNDTEVCT